MDITLNQTEIEAALVSFVGNQGINIQDKDIEISLTVGRGGNGSSASIALTSKGTKTSSGFTDEKPAMKPVPKDPPPFVVEEVMAAKGIDVKSQVPEPGFAIDPTLEAGPIETDSLFGA